MADLDAQLSLDLIVDGEDLTGTVLSRPSQTIAQFIEEGGYRNAVAVTDLNDAPDGFFFAATGATNLPPSSEIFGGGGISGWYGITLTTESDASKVQTVFSNSDQIVSSVVRSFRGGSWSDWSRSLTTNDFQSSPEDVTADRALVPGSFGLGSLTSISAPNNDLDDISINGFYSAKYFSPSNNTANRPLTADMDGTEEFSVLHMEDTQIAVLNREESSSPQTNRARTFYRKLNGSTWSVWTESITPETISLYSASEAQAVGGTDNTRIMTPLRVKNAIDALIDAAPGALDTLNELAAALGDDPNFSTTVNTALSNRLVALSPGDTAGTAATEDVTTSATDTTAGRITKVGDYGWGTNDGHPYPNDDLNDLTGVTTAVYGSFLPSVSTTNNWPENSASSVNYILTVKVERTGAATQDLQYIRNDAVGTTRRFYRTSYSGGWTSWVELYSTGNVAASTQNLMDNGSYGLGGDCISSTDLNSISESGFYKISSANAATGNAPTSDNYEVVHYQFDGASSTQIATNAGGTDTTPINVFVRNKGTGVWTPWVELYHTGNVETTTQNLLDNGSYGLGQDQGDVKQSLAESNAKRENEFFVIGSGGNSPYGVAGSGVYLSYNNDRAAELFVSGTTDYIGVRRTDAAGAWQTPMKLYHDQNVASQTEAEVGTINDKPMTPLRTAQYVSNRIATETTAGVIERTTQSEAEAGTDNARAMTPLRTVQTLASFGFVTPEMFGAVGDGTTDDTTAVQNCLNVGGKIQFKKGAIYRATSGLTMVANSELDMNGAKLLFNVDGATYNLVTNDRCTVRNGTVENAGTNPTSNGGFQCPITIGEFSQYYTFFRNVIIEDMEIISNRPNGNGILVTSDSRNVTIRNIKFPDSATLGRAILCHWGAAGAASNGLKHPKGIVIENIEIGDFTYTTSQVDGIFISACSDVTVTNVNANLISNGSIVYLFAGDYGFQYGTLFEQRYGSGGIHLENITGIAKFGIQTNMKSDFDTIKIWPVNLVVRGGGVQSNDTAAAITAGIRLANISKATIEDMSVFNYKFGIYFDNDVTNVSIRSNKIFNNTVEGVYGAGTGYENIEVISCLFDGNNSSAGASKADIRLDGVKTLVIEKNTFKSDSVTWSFRTAGGAGATSDLRVVNNKVYGTAISGPNFSLGGSGDTDICTKFSGNFVENPATNGIKSGQLVVPAFSGASKQASSEGVGIYYYSAAPTSGSWNAGDIVFNTSPIASGAIGWVCITSGTPGTWKTFGTISA